MGLETDLGRWILDEVCLMVGRQVEKMQQDGKRPDQIFPSERISGGGKYRRPRVTKVMKIPESGIW